MAYRCSLTVTAIESCGKLQHRLKHLSHNSFRSSTGIIDKILQFVELFNKLTNINIIEDTEISFNIYHQ